MEPVNSPLPALRIISLGLRILGPSVTNQGYAIITNWNPQDPTFIQGHEVVKKDEFLKCVDSWKEAYTTALEAITKINDPVFRKILLRGLTPIPLQVLSAGVTLKPCGEGDFAGASYGWQFIGNTSKRFDVEVIENDGVFNGTHDTR